MTRTAQVLLGMVLGLVVYLLAWAVYGRGRV